MVITMILKITGLWVKFLQYTIDKLDPNREMKQEILNKMDVLKQNIKTIEKLKKQHNQRRQNA